MDPAMDELMQSFGSVSMREVHEYESETVHPDRESPDTRKYLPTRGSTSASSSKNSSSDGAPPQEKHSRDRLDSGEMEPIDELAEALDSASLYKKVKHTADSYPEASDTRMQLQTPIPTPSALPLGNLPPSSQIPITATNLEPPSSQFPNPTANPKFDDRELTEVELTMKEIDTYKEKLEALQAQLRVHRNPILRKRLTTNIEKTKAHLALKQAALHDITLKTYAEIYQKSDEIAQKSPETSIPYADQPFTFKNTESNISDYTKFCMAGNKLAQDPTPAPPTTSHTGSRLRNRNRQEPVLSPGILRIKYVDEREEELKVWDVTKFSQDVLFRSRMTLLKYKFTSSAPNKVARRDTRRHLTRKIRTKINLHPREDSPMIIAMRKQAEAATLAGAFEPPIYRSVFRYLLPRPRPLPPTSYQDQCFGKPPKRKFAFPHHVEGSGFIREQEFALMEKIICGAHKQKKRCTADGRGPRTPSRQMVREILLTTDRRFAMFSSFLLNSKVYGLEFMKSIPRTPTRFAPFSRLPLELQNLIWEHSLPDKRLCVVRSHPNRLFNPGMPNFETELGDYDLGSRPGDPYLGRTKEDFLIFRSIWLSNCQNRWHVERNANPSVRIDSGDRNAIAANEYDDQEEMFLGPDRQAERWEERLRHWSIHEKIWNRTWKIPDWRFCPQSVAPLDAVSALLQTCQDSRSQVLLNYTPAFERRGGSKQYCNFKTDAVYLHFSGQRRHNLSLRHRLLGIPLNREVLSPKSRLLGSRAILRNAINEDFGKVEHLVIKGLQTQEPNWSKFADFIVKRFPNVTRITVDATECLFLDCPGLWDPYTTPCNLQRWLGDSWFTHLPNHKKEPSIPTFLFSAEKFLGAISAMTKESPDWNPIASVRELADRRRDATPLVESNYYCHCDTRGSALGEEWKNECA